MKRKGKKNIEYISQKTMVSSIVDVNNFGWIQRYVNGESHQMLDGRTTEFYDKFK